MARPAPAALKAFWRVPLERLRARLKARPDSEHEQAFVRILNALLLCLYIIPQDLDHWLVYFFYLVAGLAIIAAVLRDTNAFFFQAEDGIRDRTVTGVQTCALPIYRPKVPGPQ